MSNANAMAPLHVLRVELITDNESRDCVCVESEHVCEQVLVCVCVCVSCAHEQ